MSSAATHGAGHGEPDRPAARGGAECSGWVAQNVGRAERTSPVTGREYGEVPDHCIIHQLGCGWRYGQFGLVPGLTQEPADGQLSVERFVDRGPDCGAVLAL